MKMHSSLHKLCLEPSIDKVPNIDDCGWRLRLSSLVKTHQVLVLATLVSLYLSFIFFHFSFYIFFYFQRFCLKLHLVSTPFAPSSSSQLPHLKFLPCPSAILKWTASFFLSLLHTLYIYVYQIMCVHNTQNFLSLF